MFDRADIYTYHRDKQGCQSKKQSRFRQSTPTTKKEFVRPKSFSMAWVGQALAKESLILCLVGLFLGRAILLGELSPFGVSFVCAVTWLFGALPLVVLSTLVGLLTVTSGSACWSSGTVLAAGFLTMLSIKPQINRPWLVVPGVAVVTTLTIKAIFISVQQPHLYAYITAGFEAVFAGVLTFLFLQCMAPFARGAAHRTLSGEAIFCLLILLAGVIAGTGGLEYQFITLRGVISRFIILLGALLGGAGIAAATGAVVGVIPGLSFVVAPVIIGAYSFAGVLAGSVKNFGKLAVAVGFLLGNIVLAVYISNYGDLKSVLAETALATVLFLLFPATWQERIKEHLPRAHAEAPMVTALQDNRLRELTVDRIRNWASIFSELSKSFEQVSSTVQQSQEEHGLQQLFTEVSKKVCDGCALYRTCWERDFHRTYQNMLDMLSTVELQGRVTIDDLSDDLKKRCARLKEMSITITCLYETYKVNNYWHQRLLESRELVSEQLKGVSQIMDNMSSELEFDVELDGEIDEALRHQFDRLGIPVQDVYTLHKEDGLMEVGVVKQACRGEMACRFTIAPVVSKVVGRSFHVASTNCQLKSGEDICSFKLYPALRYSVDVGVAKIGKDGNSVCGDSHAILQLKEGRVALLLSDGMGSGPKAARESGTIISLLEHLLESGFGQELAVKTVNSIMMLRSTEESFSTVDLAVVDLYTGSGTFLKIGAVPSYLVRGRRVGTIKTSALPVGVVENLQFVSVTRMLEEGDLLVMISDGVFDAHRGSDADQDEWMNSMLQNLGKMGAQEAADVILELAQNAAGGRIPDDMTIITARLLTTQQ
ncbi:stage II sporulation protein E [Desulforamulus aeronauticus]|uniref:Stage II sporulation protein E n=1 Tax=Desulforamulus aeronauticus DSM 10349 TaxID=1121421 RepID=A0A1M6RSQ7_9FIRM|nr:stage II sporulation protein E [Desulforamulus aeronauticus]SHK35513.1 stage II sporulation protein E [Desulforamulus aeronauticus DSM 10349]